MWRSIRVAGRFAVKALSVLRWFLLGEDGLLIEVVLAFAQDGELLGAVLLPVRVGGRVHQSGTGLED